MPGGMGVVPQLGVPGGMGALAAAAAKRAARAPAEEAVEAVAPSAAAGGERPSGVAAGEIVHLELARPRRAAKARRATTVKDLQRAPGGGTSHKVLGPPAAAEATAPRVSRVSAMHNADL